MRWRRLPQATRDDLFQPFSRGAKDQKRDGLGLYIASQIAAAHGGELTVASSPERTRFTFTMALTSRWNRMGLPCIVIASGNPEFREPPWIGWPMAAFGPLRSQ